MSEQAFIYRNGQSSISGLTLENLPAHGSSAKFDEKWVWLQACAWEVKESRAIWLAGQCVTCKVFGAKLESLEHLCVSPLQKSRADLLT